MVDKLPKFNKDLNQCSLNDSYIWGIRARYVISGVRVVAIHVAILCATLVVWIWWQWKHPDDLQGAAVLFTVAFLLISTFWAATGVLKMGDNLARS
jgi:heme A synthase